MSSVISPMSRGALLLGAAALAACSNGSSTTPGGPPMASGTAALRIDLPAAAANLATAAALPTFHAAPVLLDEPDDMDAADSGVSASFGPHRTQVPAALAHLSTRRLTREAIEAAAYASPHMTAQALAAAAAAASDATPLASGTAVATYTPAQVRAAYGLPALPAAGSALSAAQAAQLGAGQTIYIVDAMNDPNVAAELTAFDQKFGLPACTVTPIATNAALPLPAAPTTGCVLSVVYTTTSGAMTATAPAYDSGWSTEISLDVQWVHATAPLARIVLIESPDASMNSLIAAIGLANSMGTGVVSMSFAGSEGSWTASVDGTFSVAGMTYLAATGDSGAAVNWPAVSTHVVAVGGTSLTYSGTGSRQEVAWSGTGGGVSAYTAAPAYQSSAVPGMGTVSRRNVADVAFNADPSTGQYVAVISAGSSSVGWLSAGGTSLATPQWAGVIAIANALRVQSAKAALGAPHTLFYGTIASTPASYSSAFADVTRGSDGSCTTCVARTGYDDVTGLGTPNVAAMLPLLVGSTATPAAPVVASTSVAGTAGVPLSVTVTATAADPVTYSLGGAPAGMSISGTGVVTWPTPVAGNYSVTVRATDSKTALTGQGVYTIAIAAAGPVITVSPMVGVAGKSLSGTIRIADATATSVSLTIAGVPPGMGFSLSGQTITATWASPVTGNYTLTISAVDSAGLKANATLPITITAH